MSSRKQLVASFLDECSDDHVGLWRLVDAVREDLGVSQDAEVRQVTRELLRDLIVGAKVSVGFPTTDGRSFTPWTLPPEQAIQRIMTEWEALGKDPDIGDIAWFTCDSPTNPV